MQTTLLNEGDTTPHLATRSDTYRPESGKAVLLNGGLLYVSIHEENTELPKNHVLLTKPHGLLQLHVWPLHVIGPNTLPVQISEVY